MPTNFKTFEAQSRLLAAVLASQPGLRLNFKAIAQHFGSDATASAIEHRFRPIRKHVAAIRQAVAEGKDAKDLAPMITMNDKEIHRYYGESTPQGLEFQFRAVKKDAKALKDAVDGGESPLTAKVSSTTPRKRRAPAAKDNDGVGGTNGSSGSRKRTPATKKPIVLTNDEDEDSEVDYDLLDVTPTHSPKKRSRTATTVTVSAPPSSAGSVSGTTTPAHPLASASWSASFPQPVTPTPTPIPAAAAHVPDATPALTVGGGTPPDPSREEEEEGEDDDDDDVFIMDTPTKSMPMKKLKLEPSSQPPVIKTEPRFLPGAAGMDDVWDDDDDYFPQPSFSHTSFSQTLSQGTSFFDNDGAV